MVNDGPTQRDRFVDGTGTGLAGMEERARVLGGVLRAGPLAAGGFGVHAELPTTVPVTDGDPSGAQGVMST